MVNRFDLVSGYMQKWPEGNWVEYEDYAALKHTLAAARTYVNDAAKTDAHAFGLLRAIDGVFKNDD